MTDEQKKERDREQGQPSAEAMQAGEQIRILHRDFANPTAEEVAEIIDREFAGVIQKLDVALRNFRESLDEREKLLASNAALRVALGEIAANKLYREDESLSTDDACGAREELIASARRALTPSKDSRSELLLSALLALRDGIDCDSIPRGTAWRSVIDKSLNGVRIPNTERQQLLEANTALRAALVIAVVPLEVLSGQITQKKYAELTDDFQTLILDSTVKVREAMASPDLGKDYREAAEELLVSLRKILEFIEEVVDTQAFTEAWEDSKLAVEKARHARIEGGKK